MLPQKHWVAHRQSGTPHSPLILRQGTQRGVEEEQVVTAPKKFPNTFLQASALPTQAAMGRSQKGTS